MKFIQAGQDAFPPPALEMAAIQEEPAPKFHSVTQALHYLVSQGMHIEHLKVEQSFEPMQEVHKIDVIMTLQHYPKASPNLFLQGVMAWLNNPQNKG